MNFKWLSNNLRKAFIVMTINAALVEKFFKWNFFSRNDKEHLEVLLAEVLSFVKKRFEVDKFLEFLHPLNLQKWTKF